jgi:hypothetical protein
VPHDADSASTIRNPRDPQPPAALLVLPGIAALGPAGAGDEVARDSLAEGPAHPRLRSLGQLSPARPAPIHTDPDPMPLDDLAVLEAEEVGGGGPGPSATGPAPVAPDYPGPARP